jgi:protein SCO1/2
MRSRVLVLGVALSVLSVAAAAAIHHSGRRPEPEGSVVPARTGSLYVLGARFTRDDGRPLTLSDLRGSYVVAGFVFTRCPSICPTLVRDLVALDRSLPAKTRQHVRFALFSVDPKHDTPDVLRTYRGRMKLELTRFTLLAGGHAAVRELAAGLGTSYGPEPDALPTHSKLVTLLGRDGTPLLERVDASIDGERIRLTLERALASEGAG